MALSASLFPPFLLLPFSQNFPADYADIADKNKLSSAQSAPSAGHPCHFCIFPPLAQSLTNKHENLKT
jgi:hypothetical protein